VSRRRIAPDRHLAARRAGEPGPGLWTGVLGLSGVTTAALAVALLGLWWNKRWGLIALPVALLLDDAVVGAMGELHWGVVVVQLGVVGTVLLATFGRARR